MRPFYAAAASFLLATASFAQSSPSAGSSSPAPSPTQQSGAQSLIGLSLPEGAPSDLFADKRREDVLLMQVLLDRSRHSPGVIDGIMGGNTNRAIRAFQEANGMALNGKITKALIDTLVHQQSGNVVQRYKLTQSDVSGPFVTVPSSMAAKAKLERLAYERPSEKIAEKFHMDEGFLKRLNPGADFSAAGTEIIVIVPGSGTIEGKVMRIEVDKAASSVRAFAEDGTLLATFPATIGSNDFPSPSGKMTVEAVAPDAKYYFDPQAREWGPERRLTIAAGPNNPVGGTWIDLSKEGYGIHGSPDPNLIGKTASHGCVRLTNWDAETLAAAVEAGAAVEFL